MPAQKQSHTAAVLPWHTAAAVKIDYTTPWETPRADHWARIIAQHDPAPELLATLELLQWAVDSHAKAVNPCDAGVWEVYMPGDGLPRAIGGTQHKALERARAAITASEQQQQPSQA